MLAEHRSTECRDLQRVLAFFRLLVVGESRYLKNENV